MKDFEICRTYLTHVSAEHKRLDKLLRQVIAMLPNWEEATGTSWREPLLARIQELRVELGHHFAQEEEGGCLEEAIAQNPEVGRMADDAIAEHPRLLAMLDAIIQQLEVQRLLDANDVQRISDDFRLLAEAIRRHEAAERAVLESGFGVSFDAFLDSIAP